MATLTRLQQEQLVDALAHAIAWEAAGAMQSVYRDKAIRMARELERAANVGNAIQLRTAVTKILDRENVA
jgi:hypothetical protein